MYGDEYKVLGEYKNCKSKILIRHNCDKCNYHEWDISPSKLLLGKGCPVCANQKIVLGVNTIWDTDRWMCNLGVSEEDAKRYSRCSHRNITVKCPDCGKEKKIRISSIYNYKSICCPCGDGKSYPEKFVMNILEQLNIDFETEYSPKWIKPKRYDFYIKGVSCIIETHGEQHYKAISRKGKRVRTLKQEQTNDKYKKEIALKNGVEYYITLDCRESSLEWIKNSILNSDLAELFDLSNINWLKCSEFANKNIVKEVCDYWNNKGESETITDLGRIFKLDISTIINYLNKGRKLGWCDYKCKKENINNKMKEVCEYWNNKKDSESMNDLFQKLGINRNTIRNYLKKGTKLGWCEYNPKEEIKKAGSKFGGYNAKKVEIFKDGQSLGIFSSCAELERQSEKLLGIKLGNSVISRVCNNKASQYKGFTFKYVEENK